MICFYSIKNIVDHSSFLVPFGFSEFEIGWESMNLIALINSVSYFLAVITCQVVFLDGIALLILIVIKSPTSSITNKKGWWFSCLSRSSMNFSVFHLGSRERVCLTNPREKRRQQNITLDSYKSVIQPIRNWSSLSLWWAFTPFSFAPHSHS